MGAAVPFSSHLQVLLLKKQVTLPVPSVGAQKFCPNREAGQEDSSAEEMILFGTECEV